MGGGKFVVATPGRSVCDDNARALAKVDALRFIALGTRRGAARIPPGLTRLNPTIGLFSYIAHALYSGARAESLRFRLHPWFDRWVKKQLTPGDHIISSYGYTNESFKFARAQGGKTFLDAGNSHPENFWQILEEEHRRWNWKGPPIAPYQHQRALTMLADVDYVLSPSEFVTGSFLSRGFKQSQIVRNVYPIDLTCFSPAARPRPASRSLRIISTGQLSLRKGTPYLLEAFALVLKKHPTAQLLLTASIAENARAVLQKYRDWPIDWAPGLPHPQLAERLRSADIFVLPSLEDGFGRTVTEALGCGLPVIVTPNTGASDVVQPGVNGEIVPIRDAPAVADATLKWADRLLSEPARQPVPFDKTLLSAEHFEEQFLQQLRGLGLLT